MLTLRLECGFFKDPKQEMDHKIIRENEASRQSRRKRNLTLNFAVIPFEEDAFRRLKIF